MASFVSELGRRSVLRVSMRAFEDDDYGPLLARAGAR